MSKQEIQNNGIDLLRYSTWTGGQDSTEIVYKCFECMQYDLGRYEDTKDIDDSISEYVDSMIPADYVDLYADSYLLKNYVRDAAKEGLVELDPDDLDLDAAFSAGWYMLLMEKVNENKEELMFNILAERFNTNIDSSTIKQIDDEAQNHNSNWVDVVNAFIKETIDEEPRCIADMLFNFQEKIDNYIGVEVEEDIKNEQSI